MMNVVKSNQMILAVNCGSSSLKLSLFIIRNNELRELQREKFIFNVNNKIKKGFQIKIQSFLQKNGLQDVDIVVHRVVHGGKFTLPMKITAAVLKQLKKCNEFAPLHNPYNIIGIEFCQKLFSSAQQYAVFDTAFHTTMPQKAKVYGLPYSFYREGIMRYGFHGQNAAYCEKIAAQFLHKKKNKLIICHLGNGSSITAVKDGRSVDTSMGFTPAEGLVMGTRAGDIDSGILEFLLRRNSRAQVFELLEKKSGLLGISGVSNDVKKLHAISLEKGRKASRVRLALDVFVYRIVKYIGAYHAVLGGCDAIVFTGGIGENAWYVREEVCKHFSFLGLKLDEKKNKKNEQKISTKISTITVFVIPANEELEMVERCVDFVNGLEKIV